MSIITVIKIAHRSDIVLAGMTGLNGLTTPQQADGAWLHKNDDKYPRRKRQGINNITSHWRRPVSTQTSYWIPAFAAGCGELDP